MASHESGHREKGKLVWGNGTYNGFYERFIIDGNESKEETRRSRLANTVAGSLVGLAILGAIGSSFAFAFKDSNERTEREVAAAEAAPADGFEIPKDQVRVDGLSSVTLDLGRCTMADVSVQHVNGDNTSYTFERTRSFSGQSPVIDSFTFANVTELGELLGGDPCQVLARTGSAVQPPATVDTLE